MGRKYKKSPGSRKYRDYTEDDIERAIHEIANGNCTVGQAKNIYNISRNTLKNKLNGKHTKKPGGQSCLTEAEEDVIERHLLQLCDYGLPLDTFDLRVMVRTYLDINRKVSKFSNNLPGIEWTRCFIKRRGLTQRIAGNISLQQAKISPDIVHNFFDNYEKEVIIEVDGEYIAVPPSNVWNYNETNLTDDPEKEIIICKRELRYPERVTNSSISGTSIMMCGNAEGETLPPYIVYRSAKLNESWTEQGPIGARYACSQSGWCDISIFEDWFFSTALPRLKNQEGRKILIGDNLSSHISFKVLEECKKHNIVFVFLPPNSTHLLQPLDVAFFHPMKVLWTQIVAEMAQTETLFPMLLHKLVEGLKIREVDNLVNGFRRTGLFPVNRYAVLERLPNYNCQPRDLELTPTYNEDNDTARMTLESPGDTPMMSFITENNSGETVMFFVEEECMDQGESAAFSTAAAEEESVASLMNIEPNHENVLESDIKIENDSIYIKEEEFSNKIVNVPNNATTTMIDVQDILYLDNLEQETEESQHAQTKPSEHHIDSSLNSESNNLSPVTIKLSQDIKEESMEDKQVSSDNTYSSEHCYIKIENNNDCHPVTSDNINNSTMDILSDVHNFHPILDIKEENSDSNCSNGNCNVENYIPFADVTIKEDHSLDFIPEPEIKHGDTLIPTCDVNNYSLAKEVNISTTENQNLQNILLTIQPENNDVHNIPYQLMNTYNTLIILPYNNIIQINKRNNEEPLFNSNHIRLSEKKIRTGNIRPMKSFKCTICYKQFQSVRALNIHHTAIHVAKNKPGEKQANSKIIYACHLCSNKYMLKCTLNRHIKKMHNVQEEFIIPQPITNEMTSNNPRKSGSLYHNMHIKEKYYSLYKHIFKHHHNTKEIINSPNLLHELEVGFDTQGKMSCLICKCEFEDTGHLEPHFKQIHKESIVLFVYQCKLCDCCYCDYDKMYAHLNTHHILCGNDPKRKDYSSYCNTCHKMFHACTNYNSSLTVISLYGLINICLKNILFKTSSKSLPYIYYDTLKEVLTDPDKIKSDSNDVYTDVEENKM